MLAILNVKKLDEPEGLYLYPEQIISLDSSGALSLLRASECSPAGLCLLLNVCLLHGSLKSHNSTPK